MPLPLAALLWVTKSWKIQSSPRCLRNAKAVCRERRSDFSVLMAGGDGEWMRSWEADCKEAGANLVQEGVICNEEPDEEAKGACQNLGKALAQ